MMRVGFVHGSMSVVLTVIGLVMFAMDGDRICDGAESIPSFAELLQQGGIDDKQLAQLSASRQPTTSQRQVIDRVLFRLDRLDRDTTKRFAQPFDWQSADNAKRIGRVLTVSGRLRRCQVSDPIADASGNVAKLLRCEVARASGDKSCVVWTSEIPKGMPLDRPLDERVRFHGVLAATQQRGDDNATVTFIARRLAWLPDERGTLSVSGGKLLLATLGVDIAQFDHVHQTLPLLGSEGDAFYDVLCAAKDASDDRLHRAARRNLTKYAAPFRKQLAAANDPRSQRALVAKAVVEAADENRYSVAPFFLDAENQSGELVMIEGVARRAIEIHVDAETRKRHFPCASGSAPTRYFELEVFTSDSQDLPLVCCVTSLPKGFPIGDEIRADVRVAGFFFKKWRYTTRQPRPVEEGKLPFADNAAPLIIAATPQLLPGETSSENTTAGWFFGGGFIVLLVLTVVGIWWWSRSDRRVRRNVGREEATVVIRPPDAE